jgi:hypothetical protein
VVSLKPWVGRRAVGIPDSGGGRGNKRRSASRSCRKEGPGRVRVEAWARLSVVAPGSRGETVEFHFYFHLN